MTHAKGEANRKNSHSSQETQKTTSYPQPETEAQNDYTQPNLRPRLGIPVRTKVPSEKETVSDIAQSYLELLPRRLHRPGAEGGVRI